MCWHAGRSRCSKRFAASPPRPSSPGRLPWPAATEPATAARSRSTASSNACAWKDRCCVLLNASGCLDALTAPDVARGLDAFVTKTVTPLPRDGNTPVRITETDVGMLNSIGLANPGIDRFLTRNLAQLEKLGVPVWVSVGGFETDEYAEICSRLDDESGVSAIELNVSCPNVEAPVDGAAQIVTASRLA